MGIQCTYHDLNTPAHSTRRTFCVVTDTKREMLSRLVCNAASSCESSDITQKYDNYIIAPIEEGNPTSGVLKYYVDLYDAPACYKTCASRAKCVAALWLPGTGASTCILYAAVAKKNLQDLEGESSIVYPYQVCGSELGKGHASLHLYSCD